jgi:hypothetical protein
MDLPLLIFDWKNLRKTSENIQKSPEICMKPSENFKNSGKLRKCQYIYLAGPQAENIFRSMDSLVLRQPINMYGIKTSGVLTV